ncbi:hypothetical protein CBM2634_P90003 [Cupriavidus taiwanensis]|uniref:Transposase n=1 Tax=Cupriavidus taiwanensis TaxID=164546 RepID=A0A375JBA8_9BURK|nr:hypothetical protein CBM2634_P90003 [Cupriavidus taiwanensis]
MEHAYCSPLNLASHAAALRGVVKRLLTIQAWAGHKNFVRKDGGDKDENDGADFKGRKRSNETHESKTDPDAKLYRKGKTASELRYMGHPLSDNRHGLVVSAMVTNAGGHAEREAAKVMHQRCQAGN